MDLLINMNKLLVDYYTARKEHDSKLELLNKETFRIITVIAKFFKKRNYWWSYEYYESGNDDPPLPQKLGKNDTDFGIFISEEMANDVVDYAGGFPIKFFDMTDEEILDYLKKETDEANEQEQKRKEKLKMQKEEKEKRVKSLKESAMSKLTKEERKALKV